MFVVMAHTRGDDLFPSKTHALFASEDRAECETKMASIQRERDTWLAANEHKVPGYQKCVIFARFEIVETASGGTKDEPKQIDWFRLNRS